VPKATLVPHTPVSAASSGNLAAVPSAEHIAWSARVLENHRQLEQFLHPEHAAAMPSSILKDFEQFQKQMLARFKTAPGVLQTLHSQLKPTGKIMTNAKMVKQPSFKKKTKTAWPRRNEAAIVAVIY